MVRINEGLRRRDLLKPALQLQIQLESSIASRVFVLMEVLRKPVPRGFVRAHAFQYFPRLL